MTNASAIAKAAVKSFGNVHSPTTGSSDSYGGLTGASRDAAVALTNLFNSYGLGTLAPQIIKFLQQGFSSDTISIELQNTKEYKTRFAANDARLKAGLPVLSPAEYISTENSYRQIMHTAGLPVGFYDSNTDFQNFIANDVSPTEVQSRVSAAADVIYKAPSNTTDFFKQWYNTGDLVAYALDPKVATPLVEQRIRAAEAAASAGNQGVNLTKTNAELIGANTASLNDVTQGTGFLAQELPTATNLGQIYGQQETQNDLVKEVFTNDGAAATKRKGLQSQERGSFGQSSAIGKGSLSTSSENV